MNAKPTPPARAARQALDHACGEMIRRLRGLRATHTPIAVEIHTLRKLGKTVRGGMRLIGLPQPDIAVVSAVGRLLGTPRDAVSRRTTWRRLEAEDARLAGDPSVRAIRALLEANVKAAAHRPPREVVARAVAQIRLARAALKAVPAAEWAARIEDGRQDLKGRLDKRLRRLEQGKSGSHAFHNARKALKAWLGALHHLGEPPPAALVALADVLGDVNDLHVLGAWLDAHGFSRALAPVPWRAIDETLARLEAAVAAEIPAVRSFVG